MSPLEPLAPDQRAVVALVLQQGRSYDEIAALLGIPVDAVRARAHAGLAALAPGNGLPGEITAPLADYLLGQQPERRRRGDPRPARGVRAGPRLGEPRSRERLAGVARSPLPEIPGDEPRRQPAARAPAGRSAPARRCAPQPARRAREAAERDGAPRRRRRGSAACC